MTEQQEKKNILKMPRAPLNLMTVVYGLILLYLLVQGILLFTRNHIQAYNIGTAVSDNVSGTFTGVILREETVLTADQSGYVNYYAARGERLQAGSVTCLLSEDDDLETELHRLLYGQETLKTESREQIRQAIKEAGDAYDPTDFSTAARAKADIQATVFHCLLEDGGEEFLNSLSKDTSQVLFTEESGFLMLYRDGLENMTPETVTKAALLKEDYACIERANGDYVEAGEFVCKIATGNQFTVVFPLTEEEAAGLSGKKSLSLRMENGMEITGAFSLSETQDGTRTGILTFQKYGGNFLDSRYVTFEILNKTVTGYKIPESALTEKSFFVIDEAYITEGGTNNQKGILTEQDGEAVFVPVTVYFKNEEDPDSNFIIGDHTAYIYSKELYAGMPVLPVTSEDASGEERTLTRTTLGVTASVKGVYQINNGYCIFKPVAELENSIETSYIIVSTGVRGGLQPFDRIVLDASEMKENQIIFE